MKSKSAKIAGVVAGLAFALSATTAGAQTTAETIAALQTQINALMAQLAALQGGTTTTTACTFTRSLTVGAQGADVTCLQDYLTGTGHFTFSGGSTGYFGPITQSAVAAWQAANGVAPAVGYFGPISQAKYTSVAGSTTTTTTTTTSTAGISTPGVEGTITASINPSPASGTKVYEGGSKVGVLGLKLEADLSDVRVERIKVQLSAGTSGNSDQQFYQKVASKMYVMDGSTVLASVDLNSSTVVKEGSSYYITITGINFVVPKDTTKVLTLAIDPKTSWDSTFDGDSWNLTVPANGIRAVDGAGINQYSPTAALAARSWTSAAAVVDNAALALSLTTDSPNATLVIADQNSDNDEYDELEVARVNFKVDDDDIKVTDLIVDIVRAGTTNTATATTAYIYDGSTLVGSATVAGTGAAAMSATFSNIDWVIPADTTKVLSVKLDIRDAGAAATTFAADIGVTSAVATNVTSENSEGTSITETGSAQGRTLSVRTIGPVLTLVSKSITTGGVPQGIPFSGGTSTSSLTATFNVKIKAVGGPLTLGTVASATPLFASSTATFKVYRDGAHDNTQSSVSTSTSYTISTTDTTAATGANGRVLAEGAETTIPVTFKIQGRSSAGTAFTTGLYSVQFSGIQWFNASSGSAQTTTFMDGEADWRTADVSFP